MPGSIRFKIKELLVEKHMTQTELSNISGVRGAAISNMANNKYKRVELSHVLRLMRALELDSFDQILEIVEDDGEEEV